MEMIELPVRAVRNSELLSPATCKMFVRELVVAFVEAQTSDSLVGVQDVLHRYLVDPSNNALYGEWY